MKKNFYSTEEILEMNTGNVEKHEQWFRKRGAGKRRIRHPNG